MGTPRQVLFGLDIDAMTLEQVLTRSDDHLAMRRRLLIGVVNAAKVVKLHRDDLLRASLLECDLLLADGQSVVWASKVLRRPLPERVAGIDLFEKLVAKASADNRSIYLLGAKPDVLARLESELSRRFPGVRIVGSRDGYFADTESEDVAAAITASGADMLFLGMTSPKKEIFLGKYADSLGVPILHGVGGSFDIFAGITKRAPRIWQRLGCEWLYRLLQEPGRLWRRYLTTNTAFLAMTLRELVHPMPSYRQHAPVVPQSNPASIARSADTGVE
ncbi:MAG TPA: WecB/TagA/CpsF family glycosyltransferase [Jatrophihabitans sp.]|jgi:N-acetylglucosaminyldiphosphoundecaprenol N-acetyl-beta-D-mannosaminyltransferase